MHQRSFECARCGMAVANDAEACPSCRARRRRGAVVVPVARTGPAAAQAWESHHGRTEAVSPSAPPVEGRATTAVGPGAQLAAAALHLTALLGGALAAVQAGRLLMAAVVADGAELARSAGWDVLAELASVGIALAAGAAMAALVTSIGWSALAGLNLRPLSLDPRRWAHGLGRVMRPVAALVVLSLAWRWAPGRPDRLDRCFELALGAGTAVALTATAGAARRFVLAVSAVELRHAELLVRRRLAIVERPRGRSARGASGARNRFPPSGA